MEATAQHWDRAYAERGVAGVSWHEQTPSVSLELVTSLGVDEASALIDVGGGASRLAAELVARGWSDVSVLDVSDVALAAAGPGITRICGDVLAWEPERRYRVWHDRALLHFFIADADRRAYVRTLDRAVEPGGFAVLGVFAPDGPERCSGLPVRRHSASDLSELLGAGYALREDRRHVHVTPAGVEQPFTWAVFERAA